MEKEALLEETEADVSQNEEVAQSTSREVTAPTWLRQGLVSVVVGSPRVFSKLGAKLKKMTQHKTKLESYSDDPCSYMAKRSRKCLKVIATHDRLLPFINTQLEDSVQFLKQIKEKIPQLRERDKQLYQQLLEDKRNETELQEVYKPLKKQIKLLQCSLAVYNVSEVRKSDFTDEELKCDEKPWESIIGDGSFSTVYSGVLSRTGQPKLEVALKRYREPLTTNNVMHFVDEERALRQLSHPNIVKFYGTNLQHGRNGTTVMIVLELCSRSLGFQVRSHPEEAPARLPRKAVLNKVLDWALNILDALRYIHGEGFAHRDLRLDNIFLTTDGRVKVADVGVAKHENEITGTVCSTSIYLAPEVFERRIYNSKSNMYSFGYVLWELWYGETAFAAAIESRNEYMVLEDVVKQDLRPTHIEGTQHPWESWQLVMESCWNKDPKVRLTAQKGWEKLQQREDFQQKVSSRRPQPEKSLPPRLVPPSLRQQQKREDFQQDKPPPLPPRTPSRRLAPPTKPKPATRREGKPVSYHREAEEGIVDFE